MFWHLHWFIVWVRWFATIMSCPWDPVFPVMRVVILMMNPGADESIWVGLITEELSSIMW
jgi:hypothetical protein